jgi:hypothetical protein
MAVDGLKLIRTIKTGKGLIRLINNSKHIRGGVKFPAYNGLRLPKSNENLF